ncbi:hypothetical protein [Adhaeribacter aquaticus]|uniref:hypothetical protein n=1 Tax=Adhaeribacter aquaticus TaxID=299567 RepID=UPI00047B1058|nr:hypothetical protein [Adhaeribacter aquaticus]
MKKQGNQLTLFSKHVEAPIVPEWPNFERLNMVADFLQSTKEFAQIDMYNTMLICPLVFPTDWQLIHQPAANRYEAYDYCIIAEFKNSTLSNVNKEIQSGMKYFNLSEAQYGHLFWVFQDTEVFGGSYLNLLTPKEKFIQNIKIFCGEKDAQQAA